VLKARGIDTPDFFVSILQFRKGGVATLENGWILPNTAPNIIDFKTEMVGSEGVLYTDGSHHRVFQKYTQQDATYPDVLVCPSVYGKPMGFGVDSIRAFADCVVFDRAPLVGAVEGERVTRTILALEESARTGSVVTV
jgi:predicted dehydrogenase